MEPGSHFSMYGTPMSKLGLAMRMYLPMRITCASMRIICILCKKNSSNFLPINCHFCSVFPNPWAESPCWPISITRSLGARLLGRPPRTRPDPRTPDPDRLWAHRVCLTFSCSVTEIENQNTTLYTELYRKRETSSSESDLKEFMGDFGIGYENCAQKRPQNIFMSKRKGNRPPK